ncbi:hypothetical protein ANN_03749 [Periplaneta americana]|uniref:Uncharacterized protein n=1 Tax=Periplaneta americana TaxID=6978 RepID=A0ABQ8TZP5_PERAM|nr:hypothetical protein ANN_03749 [Periplaneta americana]
MKTRIFLQETDDLNKKRYENLSHILRERNDSNRNRYENLSRIFLQETDDLNKKRYENLSHILRERNDSNRNRYENLSQTDDLNKKRYENLSHILRERNDSNRKRYENLSRIFLQDTDDLNKKRHENLSHILRERNDSNRKRYENLSRIFLQDTDDLNKKRHENLSHILRERNDSNRKRYENFSSKRRVFLVAQLSMTRSLNIWSLISSFASFFSMAMVLRQLGLSLIKITFQALVETGIVKHLLRKGLPPTEICPLNLRSTERQLRNGDLFTTYMVVVVGFASAIAAFVGERIPNLAGEQSDGITVFRIPPMTSLMLHRCHTGAINLQRWWQSPSAAISESDWFLYTAGISRRITSCTVVSWRTHFDIGCHARIPTRNTILRWVASFRITGSTLKKKSPGRNSIALRFSEATVRSRALRLLSLGPFEGVFYTTVKRCSQGAEIELPDTDWTGNVGYKKSQMFPPPYSVLMQQQPGLGKHQNINGRDYLVINSKTGDPQLIPVRSPSAFLFHGRQHSLKCANGTRCCPVCTVVQQGEIESIPASSYGVHPNALRFPRGMCKHYVRSYVDKLQGFYRVVLVLVADVSTAVLWSSSEQLLDKEIVCELLQGLATPTPGWELEAICLEAFLCYVTA